MPNTLSRSEFSSAQVFALRRADQRLVTKASPRTIQRLAPILAAMLGWACVTVVKAAHAADLPVMSLEGAPLEIRVRNLSTSIELNRRWAEALPPSSAPGNASSLSWDASLPKLNFKNNAWELPNPSASVEIQNWQMRSSLMDNGFGMDLSCQRARVSFLPGTLRLPMPQTLKLSLEAADGTLALRPDWNMREWIDTTLRPYFEGPRVESSVQVDAVCDGGVGDLARDLIRARLTDLPNKDPETYNRTIGRLAEGLERSLSKSIQTSFPQLPAGLRFRERFVVMQEGTSSLVFKPEAYERTDFLSAAARRQLRAPRGTGTAAQVVLTPAALDRLVRVGMTGVAVREGGRLEQDGKIAYRLPTTVKAAQFSPLLTELADLPDETDLNIEIALPTALTANGRAANPRIRPWIAANGVGGGLDIDWRMEVRWMLASGPEGSAPLASRTLGMGVTFSDNIGQNPNEILFRFESARWVPEASSTESGMTEIGLSLDWLLNSELFETYIQRTLNEGLAWRGLGGIELRRLGQANAASRREQGGYFAEALVVNVDLSR